jgi:hypothetical protein
LYYDIKGVGEVKTTGFFTIARVHDIFVFIIRSTNLYLSDYAIHDEYYKMKFTISEN